MKRTLMRTGQPRVQLSVHRRASLASPGRVIPGELGCAALAAFGCSIGVITGLTLANFPADPGLQAAGAQQI